MTIEKKDMVKIICSGNIETIQQFEEHFTDELDVFAEMLCRGLRARVELRAGDEGSDWVVSWGVVGRLIRRINRGRSPYHPGGIDTIADPLPPAFRHRTRKNHKIKRISGNKKE